MHPLRVVREAIGLTQPKFAAKVGVEAITIRRIENGTMPLSRKLALRIRLFTGAEPSGLMKGKLGKAIPVHRPVKLVKGELIFDDTIPYTKESFDAWRLNVMESTKANAVERGKDAAGWLQILFLASVPLEKFPGVWSSFMDWIEQARNEFEIGGCIDALLEKLPFEKDRTATYDFIRDPRNAVVVKAYGFKDDKRKKGTDTVTVLEKLTPGWSPQGRCPDLARILRD